MTITASHFNCYAYLLFLLMFSSGAGAQAVPERSRGVECEDVGEQGLKVMSYNLRLNVESDGDNAWPKRKEFLASQVEFHAPDVMGTQEGTPGQIDWLKERLTGYAHVGEGRQGGHKGEYSAIFYNRHRLAVKQSGTFWLSETPDTVSTGWDAALPRIVTWARFSERSGDQDFFAFNTHFDHVGTEARLQSTDLILAMIDSLNKERLPFVLTGDLNLTPETPPLQKLSAALKDAYVAAPIRLGPAGTFTGFNHSKPASRRIDYIMVDPKVKVINFATLTDAVDGRYPSDHFALVSTLHLRPRPLIIAHRGASGYAPENSLDAFRKAVELKSDMIGLAQDSPVTVENKARVLVLTDIEADPDDTQSLVRLLLYANQVDIVGLVATTSCWYRTSVEPGSIAEVIRAYGQVRDNLALHEEGFPTENDLLSLIKSGKPLYGMGGVGKDMDSEGSEWIIQQLEAKDERPLWISVWGGVNTLAQALHKIKRTRSAKEAAAMIAKLRVYTISDQDDSGIWLRNNFPDLFYIVSPGDDYGSATWNAINSVVKGIDNTTISNPWIVENIQQDHGPLGAAYPDVAWGVEGDTPAYLGLLPNGLNVPNHPEWGGWGGRYEYYLPDFSKQKKGGSGVPFEAETRPIWTDAIDTYRPFKPSQYGRTFRKDTTVFTGDKVSLWRWRDDLQHDFAARMDWCTQSVAEANHPPVAVLNHPERITVRSGEAFSLDASKSYDRDGDNLSFLWFPYPEAGTYRGDFEIGQPENAHRANATAPEVDQPETIHIILKVSDKGTPVLSRYRRIIVTVEPK